MDSPERFTATGSRTGTGGNEVTEEAFPTKAASGSRNTKTTVVVDVVIAITTGKVRPVVLECRPFSESGRFWVPQVDGECPSLPMVSSVLPTFLPGCHLIQGSKLFLPTCCPVSIVFTCQVLLLLFTSHHLTSCLILISGNNIFCNIVLHNFQRFISWQPLFRSRISSSSLTFPRRLSGSRFSSSSSKRLTILRPFSYVGNQKIH